MAEIVKTAVSIRQGNHILHLTSFTAAEFAGPGFFSVEALDPETSRGFQRILEDKRRNRVATYLASMRGENRAFLPTSVFLATDADIAYDSQNHTIKFDTDKIGAFNVVDGQHRIKGLIKAAEDVPSLATFPLATIIAAGLGKLEQKLHFYLVNTTQKPVDKSVQQRIKAELHKKRVIGEEISLPEWLGRDVAKDDIPVALNIADALNENINSPWRGEIQMPGHPRSSRALIKQDTLVKSIQKYILVRGHILHKNDLSEEMRNEMLCNYWCAVTKIFAGGNISASVVLKSNGAIFFHSVSMAMFDWLSVTENYTVPRIKECFEKAFVHLSADDLVLSQPEWWRVGGGVSGVNTSAISKKADIMARAVYKANAEEQEMAT